MKYESAILKRLIDTYGVVGNPKYISEIIKEFIVRGKERFPNLFTYQADWLAHIDEFGLSPSYTVSYTGQSIYAPNTLERPVKRAILKGQTEGITDRFEQGSYSNWNGSAFSKSDSQTRIRTKDVYSHIGALTLSVNSGYQLFLRSVEIESGNEHTDGWIQSHTIVFNTERKFVVIISKVDGSNISVDEFSNIGFETNSTKMTELKSVKMPVLTTTGKNLWRTDFIVGKRINAEGNVTTGSNYACIEEYIKILPKTSYVISNSITGNGVQIFEYDSNKNLLNATWAGTGKITTQAKTEYFRYSAILGGGNNSTEEALRSFQFELGTVATPYEPYKSNILTANEDVTLRSNGDICDELNLLTGQLTQRIGEDGVVLSQEVVKTVELTILDQNRQNVKQLMSFNGGTHFNAMSSDGTPLPTVNVSVETDLVETLNICSMDGNTL